MIEKAIENGWRGLPIIQYTAKKEKAKYLHWKQLENRDYSNNRINPYLDFTTLLKICQQRKNELIFSHDFAKAFWGEKTAWNMDTCSDCNYAKKNISCAVCDRYNPGWQSYLQTMVLQTEPLKYLEKFL